MNIGGISSPAHLFPDADFAIRLGGVGLTLGARARVLENEHRVLAFDGQVFDVSLEKLLTDTRGLDTAFGSYAYVLHDKLTGETRIGTDRFGYFPFYYALEAGRIFFSTTIRYVKAALQRCSPDYEAWEEILILGEIIGDKTPIREIKRLPVGTRLNLREGHPKLEKHWVPELPDILDEDTYIRESNRLLDEAVALTSLDKLPKVVFLSGGEDSRRLAIAAVRQQFPVRFFTQEAIHHGGIDYDTTLAQEVATALNRPLHLEPLPEAPQYLADISERDALLGFESTEHEWLFPAIRSIGEPSLVYDGIVGDVTVNGHYFKRFPAAIEQYRDLDRMAGMLCGHTSPPWIGEISRRTDTSLFDRVRAQLASYPDSPHRLTFYFLFNHTRRKIALVSQMLSAHGHSTCYPFLYYPLFVQSLSIDPKLQLSKFYQRECMVAVAPDVARIPTTRGTVPQRYGIDRTKALDNQVKYLLRHLQCNSPALDTFPAFRWRAAILPLLRMGGSGRILERFAWFLPMVARFSAFHDWLDRKEDWPLELPPSPGSLGWLDERRVK